MSKKNNVVFDGLYIIAWIIFVGLCIETGSLLVNFSFNLFKPDTIQNLYHPLDLTYMYQDNQMAFFGIYSFILFISILKAYLFYIVITLMHKMDLTKPFSTFVSKQISKMSYFTLSIGVLSYIAKENAKNLMHHGYAIEDLSSFWVDSEAFVLMGAVLYIIATIFKKGVDLQNENDLTV